jgi:hypothetical protein
VAEQEDWVILCVNIGGSLGVDYDMVHMHRRGYHDRNGSLATMPPNYQAWRAGSPIRWRCSECMEAAPRELAVAYDLLLMMWEPLSGRGRPPKK